MKITKILLLCMFFCQMGLAQEVIKGNVSNNGYKISGVEVINLNSKQSTKTDKNGCFEIAVSEKDTLIFTSSELEYYQKIIKCEDFEAKEIQVVMFQKMIELENVTVFNYSKINARSLGIIPQNTKTLTQAERRLASDRGGVFGFVNLLNGKASENKKILEAEKKQNQFDFFQKFIAHSYYIETLKMKEYQIASFQYYCLEQPDFLAALESKNKYKTLFQINKLYPQFYEMQRIN